MHEIELFLDPNIAENTSKPQQSDNPQKTNNLYIKVSPIADKLLKENVLQDVWGERAEVVVWASEGVKKSHQTFHRGDAEAQRFENKGSFLCVSAPLR
jgi:hypothetical protein